MLSTMQDAPLLVSGILRHGQQVYGDSQVITITGPDGESVEASFTEVAERAERLAKALGRLGVGDGDRVGTFLWNNQTHLEAYLAVPAMGAVLHTLNLRLFPEQLAYVINHAEDQVIIVDASLVPLLARVRDQLTTVKHIIVAGDGRRQRPRGDARPTRSCWPPRSPATTGPTFDERQAAAMCYTSGTTGNPKGVVYSHRSTYLHSMAITSGSALGINEQDRVLSIVPMFHANAWGTPYGGFLTGADLVMPQQFLQAEPLVRHHRRATGPPCRPGCPPSGATCSATPRPTPVDLSSLRMITAGRRGRAPPADRAVPGRARRRDGPGLGHDRDQPAVLPGPPAAGYAARRGDRLAGQDRPGGRPASRCGWWPRTGRSCPTTASRWGSSRSGARGSPAPTTGIRSRSGSTTAGCGPGTSARSTSRGFMQISDRTKDVIKSGGEWISSVELENEVMAHPGVVEAAVIAVPDERWSERPLVAVVLEEGSRRHRRRAARVPERHG